MQKHLSERPNLLIVSATPMRFSKDVGYEAFEPVVREIENMKHLFKNITWIGYNYNNDLSLVSRENNNSMILDYQKMLKRLENVINDNKIQTIGGDYKKILADTFCVHGDSLEIASVIRDLFNEINKHNLEIE